LRDEASNESRASDLGGISLGAALRTRQFWVLGASGVFASAAVTGLLTNFASVLRERNIDRPTVAILVGAFGAAAVLGRVLAGALLDRIWGPAVAIGFFMAAAAALGALAGWTPSLAVIALCVVTVGLAAGAEVDVSAYLSARYFGLRHYSIIFGCIFQMLAVGGGLSAPFFGWMYDLTGSYTDMLATAAVCYLFAALTMACAGKYRVGAD
jgi:predicted MFS family arabinose efflux permease